MNDHLSGQVVREAGAAPPGIRMPVFSSGGSRPGAGGDPYRQWKVDQSVVPTGVSAQWEERLRGRVGPGRTLRVSGNAVPA